MFHSACSYRIARSALAATAASYLASASSTFPAAAAARASPSSDSAVGPVGFSFGPFAGFFDGHAASAAAHTRIARRGTRPSTRALITGEGSQTSESAPLEPALVVSSRTGFMPRIRIVDEWLRHPA